MLQVEHLAKSYGDRVLFSEVSFAIDRGQKVGLIAPNGTGKSTLMRILLGLEPQDTGSVVYERDLRRAFLPQLPDLPKDKTILEACFSQYDPVARLTLNGSMQYPRGTAKRWSVYYPRWKL